MKRCFILIALVLALVCLLFFLKRIVVSPRDEVRLTYVTTLKSDCPECLFLPLSYKFLHSREDIERYFSYSPELKRHLFDYDLDFFNNSYLLTFGKKAKAAYYNCSDTYFFNPLSVYRKKSESVFIHIIYEGSFDSNIIYMYRLDRNIKFRGYEGPG